MHVFQRACIVLELTGRLHYVNKSMKRNIPTDPISYSDKWVQRGREYFLISLLETEILDTRSNRLIEAVRTSTHNLFWIRNKNSITLFLQKKLLFFCNHIIIHDITQARCINAIHSEMMLLPLSFKYKCDRLN